MRRIITLIVVLAVSGIFSSVVMAGDFGSCEYSSHANQAQADKTDTAQPVAKVTTPKPEAEKLVLAQTNKSSKPAATKTNLTSLRMGDLTGRPLP